MRIISIPINSENVIISATENRKMIIANLAEASVYDSKTAKHLKEGNYEKAAYCAILAQEYIRLASEAKRNDIKLHALYN
jgi:hypothetical protein